MQVGSLTPPLRSQLLLCWEGFTVDVEHCNEDLIESISEVGHWCRPEGTGLNSVTPGVPGVTPKTGAVTRSWQAWALDVMTSGLIHMCCLCVLPLRAASMCCLHATIPSRLRHSASEAQHSLTAALSTRHKARLVPSVGPEHKPNIRSYSDF